MIIGFFGKGGSGKTTTCFRFLQDSRPAFAGALAIDADHNMDLSYNLGVTDAAPYVGASAPLEPGLELLAAGPHTEEVFNGEVCSHYLFRPLKALLDLQEDPETLVVVDNTAGMDSVGAGIPARLDVAIVCVEPAVHSIKVGKQIVEALKRTHTPTVIAATKIKNKNQQNEIGRAFEALPMIVVPFAD
jgi:CO dehydrogenase nickel-insertion accessory protein CooC1